MVRVAAIAIVALASTASAQNRYLVKFKNREQGKAALHASGARIAVDLGPQRAAAAYVPAHALERLRANPNIERIEVDPVRQPLAQSTPYGIPMVQADLIPTSSMATNRTVCIIDSGLYTGHEDLQKSNVSGYPSGWDTDGCGHGTHVAGTIAALTNETGVLGVLPHGVNLHIVKVFGDNCSWNYASGLMDALNRCRAAGANVVSMSLGGSMSSTIEQSAFQDAWNAGVLSVAAAGNNGSTSMSFPASYPSVISVAALDSNKNVASFSQHNVEVDVAAPGVFVPSTMSWKEQNTLAVGGGTYSGNYLSGAVRTPGVSGTVVDGGLCDAVGSWGGKVVMCKRGLSTFAAKAGNVASGGGVAAVIYNEYPGLFTGTLNGTGAIPVIGISKEDGEAIIASRLNLVGTVVSSQTKPGSGYESWSGTSMATPHVSAVAALLWSQNTGWSNAQIRQALEATALDLGASGRDDYYGHGLIQAKPALAYLQGDTSNRPPLALFTFACSGLSCNFSDNSSDSDGVVTTWSWSLGDGSTSVARNPSRTYAAPGTYTVRLTVVDDYGATGSATTAVTVNALPVNNPPTAMFSYSCVGLSCTFTDRSMDSDGTITGWSWTFGDGTSSTAQHPSHAFAASGTYAVILTVTDDDGTKNSYSSSVTVSGGTAVNKPPVASYSYSCTGLSCTFSDRSVDSDGLITGWTWSFGDGAASTAQHPSHVFGASGTYTVTLTARDNAGATNSYSSSVIVSAPAPAPNNPPVASFVQSCAELSCAFTDASTDSDGAIGAWSWSFGDGTSSTARNPSHVYAAGGTYTVSLTVTDDDGASATLTKSLTVSAPVPISISARGYKVKGLQAADLAWAGATTSDVDVYRNGARIATTPNDRAHTDNINSKGSGTYRYRICNAGSSSICSPEALVAF